MLSQTGVAAGRMRIPRGPENGERAKPARGKWAIGRQRSHFYSGLGTSGVRTRGLHCASITAPWVAGRGVMWTPGLGGTSMHNRASSVSKTRRIYSAVASCESVRRLRSVVRQSSGAKAARA